MIAPARRRLRIVNLLLCGALALPALTATPVAARPFFCLPPIFDAGQRIHPLPAPRVFWTELLLRQHELCWRKPAEPGEVRIALIGNSAIYGFPHLPAQTVGGFLNEYLDSHHLPAHVFNLAMVATYQLRDALVIHEALPYDPDIIVYPVTLSEYAHYAPAIYPPQLVEFLASNKETLVALAANPPPGLAEPLEIYRTMIEESGTTTSAFTRLREVGAFVRVIAQRHAQVVANLLSSVPLTRPPTTRGRQTQYDCKQTVDNLVWQYSNWQDWNILSYLQEVQEQHGVAVLIVNWPVAHEPVGECYNVRYSNAIVAEFNQFLEKDTEQRGLRYLDLHGLLPADAFLDSLHLTPEGHRQVAEKIGEALAPMIRNRFKQVTSK